MRALNKTESIVFPKETNVGQPSNRNRHHSSYLPNFFCSQICLSFGFFSLHLFVFFLCDCFSSMGRTRFNRWIDTNDYVHYYYEHNLVCINFSSLFLIPNRRWLFIYLSLPPVAFSHFFNFVNVILRKKRHFSRLFCSLNREKKGKIDACFCML